MANVCRICGRWFCMCNLPTLPVLAPCTCSQHLDVANLQAEVARLRELLDTTVALHAQWLRLSVDDGPLADPYPTKMLKRTQAEHHAATNDALAALSAHIAAIDAATGGTK